MHDYHRILALVDFSEAGTKVAQRAIRLARLGQTELAFLHLIEPDPSADGGYPAPSRVECEHGFEQAALRRLAFLKSTLDADNVELLARYGQPAHGFSESVMNWRPDLVVAGGDPGYLGGRHDLLILGRPTRTRGLGRLLRQFMAPAGLLGGV